LKNFWPKGPHPASAKEHTKNRRGFFPSKSDVDANYVKLFEDLMKSGIYHGLARTTRKIMSTSQAFATAKNFPATRSISNALGIRRDLQRKLVRTAGASHLHSLGTECIPYFMRRLGERPAK